MSWWKEGKMRRVLALLCGVTMLTSCGVPGGVVVAGRASQVSPPPSTPPLPSGTPASTDPIAVLRADPQLDSKIKAELAPCGDGHYPVDDRYMDLTGDGKAELVVTLYSCEPLADKVEVPQGSMGIRYAYGWAGFVYNLATDPPTRLLGVQDAEVTIVAGKDFASSVYVIRTSWGPKDDPCCPTEQTFAQYRWDGTKFVEVLQR
jgi:hypothetical protein